MVVVMAMPSYTRRSLLRSGAAGVACALSASPLGVQAQAQAPAGEPGGAAHHHFSFGGHDIFVLSDGHLVVPSSALAPNVADAEVKPFLAARGLGPDRVHFHINVALVGTGSDYVLIDAGSGGTWEPTAGKLADSLEAAGLKPAASGKGVLAHAPPHQLWGTDDQMD